MSFGSIIDVFGNDRFLLPFLSTVGASLTIIFLNFLSRYIKDRKKKLYGIACIADISFRALLSDLMLKKRTVLPHIVATKKIIAGDTKLLETMFLADEFDILTDAPFNLDLLSEEYKILLGNDDITMVRAYEFIVYSNKNDATQKAFNNFVKENLKSQHLFSQKNLEQQQDILSTYWDYLDRIKHEMDRNISNIILLYPVIEKYIAEKQFLLFRKRSIIESFAKTEQVISDYNDVLPERDFVQNIGNGGIQNAL